MHEAIDAGKPLEAGKDAKHRRPQAPRGEEGQREPSPNPR